MKTHIEQDCTVEHEGHKFTSRGAVVTPDIVIAYLGNNGVLTDWHGATIGTYRITSTWPTPRSYVSGAMHQVRAVVDGVTYTGRSAGIGLIYRGKRVR